MIIRFTEMIPFTKEYLQTYKKYDIIETLLIQLYFYIIFTVQIF